MTDKPQTSNAPAEQTEIKEWDEKTTPEVIHLDDDTEFEIYSEEFDNAQEVNFDA